jgi:hypothetical protein
MRYGSADGGVMASPDSDLTPQALRVLRVRVHSERTASTTQALAYSAGGPSQMAVTVSVTSRSAPVVWTGAAPA